MRGSQGLLLLVVLTVGCGTTDDSRDQAIQEGERRADAWTRVAAHSLDKLKHVCDGWNLTLADVKRMEQASVQHWAARVDERGTGGTITAVEHGWAVRLRTRVAQFERQPEWKQACQEAWAIPIPELGPAPPR